MVKKILFIVMSSLALTATSLNAYDASPRCYRQIESTFFESRVIMLALEYFRVPQSAWILISRDLSRQNYRIPFLVRQRAKKLRPNPLENPFNAQETIKLLKQVSYELFVQTMEQFKSVQYLYEQNWDGIFDYIFDAEVERLKDCLKLQHL